MQPERRLAQEGLLADLALVPHTILIMLPTVLLQIGLALELLGAELAFVQQAEIRVRRQMTFERALPSKLLLAVRTHMELGAVGVHVAFQDDLLLEPLAADAAEVLQLVLVAPKVILQVGTGGKPLRRKGNTNV